MQEAGFEPATPDPALLATTPTTQQQKQPRQPGVGGEGVGSWQHGDVQEGVFSSSSCHPFVSHQDWSLTGVVRQSGAGGTQEGAASHKPTTESTLWNEGSGTHTDASAPSFPSGSSGLLLVMGIRAGIG